MARIQPVQLDQALPKARAELERQIAAHGRTTNMKRTLAHSPTALDAYMRWYDLHAEVVEFLGERLAMLLAHAVSAQTDCLICSTFFRRWLVEAGENPDDLRLDEREGAVVEFGRQLARDANRIGDDLYASVARHFSPEQMVTLTAFGGLMIATNIFNNALRVDLDEYLIPFRKGAKS
jgi:alkylhydroperoxidase family enzyme